MRIPSNEYFANLLNEYCVPNPIRRHCEVVTKVGVILAKQLLQAGVHIDVLLVEAGCRVHDAFKAASLKELTPIPELGYVPAEEEIEIQKRLSKRFKGIHETLIAAQMLQSEYPEFADFVSRIGSTGNPCYLEEGIELKVLHYADWRVQLDQIISFDDRLAYLCKAYKDSWEKTGISWDVRYQQEKEIEREIFKKLDYSPDDLARIVERY